MDVDANGGEVTDAENPVENLAWKSPSEGVYTITVHQFTDRGRSTEGFTLEFDDQSTQTTLTFSGKVSQGRKIEAASFRYVDGTIQDFKILSNSLTVGTTSKEIWGLTTNSFVPVSTLLFSPNHWVGSEVGNKHWFFILKDCKNPDPVRGIYNEYLRSDLDKHRKVFDLIGDKTTCEPAEEQLSGLGFSSTKRANVEVRVTTEAGQRTYNVQF